MSNLNVLERIRKAAKRGDLFAQNELGICLDCGYDCAQNFPSASRWYAKAAKQGHHSAKSNLLLQHVLGHASQYRPTEVIAELRRLAISGDASAQNNLGLCYQFGYGTKTALHS